MKFSFKWKSALDKHISNFSVSVLATILNMSTLLIMIRIYSVQEVGKFGSLMGIVTIVGTILLFSLPQLMTQHKDRDGIQTLIEFFLACFLLLAILSFVGLSSLLLFSWLADSNDLFLTNVFLVCLGVCVINVWTIYRTVATLDGSFKFQSNQNLASATIQISAQTTFSVISPTHESLFLGFSLGKVYSIFRFYAKFGDSPSLKNSKTAIGILKKEFLRVILFSTSAQTISIMAGVALAPLLLLVTSVENVGVFFIGFQIAGLFSSVLGSSLSSIILGELYQKSQNGETISRFVSNLVFSLGGMAFLFYPLFLLFLWSFGDVIFPADWQEAIPIVEILVPWCAANFISSIVSVTATITDNFSFIFRITFFESTLRMVAILCGTQVFDFRRGVLCYSSIGVLNSVIWIFFCLRFSGYPKQRSIAVSSIILLGSLGLMTLGYRAHV
jgi:O-antigen/teichoic acid export membrane protein